MKAQAQFAVDISVDKINKIMPVSPERILETDSMYCNRYIIEDVGIIDYFFKNDIAVVSVFLPENGVIDLQTFELNNENMVVIDKNIWISYPGTSLCMRIYDKKIKKAHYVCQLQEF